MDRVVNFYARLPRGSAPETKATGLIGRYQARYFGKNPSAARKFFPLSLLPVVVFGFKRVRANQRSCNSPRPRHRCHPDPGLQHGVLLPPAYVSLPSNSPIEGLTRD